jgi:hypothetical protein
MPFLPISPSDDSRTPPVVDVTDAYLPACVDKIAV